MSIHPVNKKGHSHCRGIINTQSPQKKIESERIQNFSRRPLGYFIIQQKINKINKSYEKIKQLDSVSSIDSRFSSLCVFNIHNNRYVTAITRKPHSRLPPSARCAAFSFFSFLQRKFSFMVQKTQQQKRNKKKNCFWNGDSNVECHHGGISRDSSGYNTTQKKTFDLYARESRTNNRHPRHALSQTATTQNE